MIKLQLSSRLLDMQTVKMFYQNEIEVVFNETEVINENFTNNLMNNCITLTSISLIFFVNAFVLIWLKIKVNSVILSFFSHDSNLSNSSVHLSVCLLSTCLDSSISPL